MHLLYYDIIRNPELEQTLSLEYQPLRDLLAKADIVVILVPLLDETRRMIGEKELRLMKSGALLVNTARGAIIDEHALYWGYLIKTGGTYCCTRPLQENLHVQKIPALVFLKLASTLRSGSAFAPAIVLR